MGTLLESINRLNPPQRQAVQTTEGPVLIAAGAGSGKTRVVTHRIAYLVQEKQIRPWQILAITFTNKAAKEMRDRVEALVGAGAQDIWVMTFHAMCARILRREATHLGYDKNFTIVDTGEQQTLMKSVLKELDLDSSKFHYKDMLYVIDDAKNKNISADEFEQLSSGFIDNIHAKVYRRYQQKLKASNAMDFNDLIMLTVKLFEEVPEVLAFYQTKFQYIHVDEYQDTNESQYKLINLLAAQHHNICVVGDADQSIYAWRGANMENILNFEKDYPQATSILLEQNYRSTQTILNAANSVIKNNARRKAKQLWSDGEVGEKVVFHQAYSDKEEALFVVNEIEKIKANSHAKYSDFAILYRTQAQSRGMEEKLMTAQMPYKIIGGLKFYARKEILDTLAYLKLIDNSQDNLSFNRIINVPKRGIGGTTIEKLAAIADSMSLSWYDTIPMLTTSHYSKAALAKLQKFHAMIEQLKQQSEFLTVSELSQQVWEQTHYAQTLKEEGTIEAENRLENLEEFASVTKAFDDIPDAIVVETDPDFLKQDEMAKTEDHIPQKALTRFLTELSLVSDTDEQTSQSHVTLMTLHAAKGLEFPYVFIIGMEEGLFPSGRSLEEDPDAEEERRLAYVGMTRAEKLLYLTATRSRLLYGRVQQNMLSRFVREINPAYVENFQNSSQYDNVSLFYDDTSFDSPFSTTDQKSTTSRFNRQATTGSGFNNRNRPDRPQTVAEQSRRDANKAMLSQRTTRSSADHASSPFDTPVYQVGDKIQHKTWGEGTIVAISQTGKDEMLSVAFPTQGIKQLLSAFAPITKI